MTEANQLTLSAELESLSAFREFIKTTCNDLKGLTAEALYDIQLAVDEVCTNIITHGYEGMDPGSIILRVEPEPGRVVVSITDFGHPFEPVEPEAPNLEATLEEREEGGLGLFFVFMSIDDITYESSAVGNTTTLIKKYRGE